MTDTTHGGKREGSGRPKGSVTINQELRDSFREHTETALNAIVSIAENKEHPHHLKACELILARGYGAAPAPNEAEDIINRFIIGDITAIQAGLLLESKGLSAGKFMQGYIVREYTLAKHEDGFTLARFPLPKQ